MATQLSNITPQSCRPAFLAPAELFTALDAIACELRAEQGEAIFREGAISTGVYVLRSGRVRAFLAHKDGRELVNRILGPGAILGFPAAMCSRSFQFSAEALDDAVVGFIPTTQLNEYLRTRPDLCMQVVTMMSDELIELRQTRDHMKTCTDKSCSLHDSCKCAH